MPSLFSRSRTNSTPKKSSATATYDEFGRINSRGSARGLSASPLQGSKRDKRKDSKDKLRGKTASPDEPDPTEFSIPDGTFLPLNLEQPRIETSPDDPAREPPPSHDYGYLSYRRHVVLGLEQVARLVDVVGNELGIRGLTTPFIFSTLALDVSSNSVKRLLNAFLGTCSKPSAEADRQWREEARLAGPHELGMCLRWGLARVVRIMHGQEVRGLVSYDSYVEWRDAEAALNYPEMHFAEFVAPLDSLLRSILVGLFTLLSRFTAHSASSGHTPPTLSPLFGPLLFGLGPSTLAFHHAYMYYVRATTATEHLILAFIRWQDAPRSGASGASSGVPTRLKAWIQGYPTMLPAIGKPDRRPEPRRGARTVRVVSVRRNVRMYSPDLVKSAASWAQRPRGSVSSMAERIFAGSKEWERIAPPTLKLPPRYSDAYRKRMDLPASFHPDTGTASSASLLSAPSLASSVSTASSSSIIDEKEHGIGLGGGKVFEDRFRSLTDLKWGEFEVMGFGDLGADEKKLQFDLTEGARAARAAKRATLTWQDFSSTGFSRTDAPLNATLQFSTPVANTINAWPSHAAEIHRKLKKTQKGLPSFGWDTEPVLGTEEVIEEAFMDVFCDLVYGGGWMDIERCEETDRECNWALVEFKSLPISKTSTVSGTGDPRTSTTLILFEEFVPLEYRQQLAGSGRTRRRLPSLFGASARKQWKPATTLNGRPYVVGHVPNSPSYREVEFEGLLRENGSATKIISLNRNKSEKVSVAASPALEDILASPITNSDYTTPAALSPGDRQTTPTLRVDTTRSQSPAGVRLRPQKQDVESPIPIHRRASRFRLPTGLPVSPGGARRSAIPPAEYESVDFDARLASFSDDDLSPRDKHGRRRSKDDAWVDILVASNSRRLQGQDAELRRNGSGRMQARRSDPELASQEVSEVLAAVRGQVFSDDEDENSGMEPVSPPFQTDSVNYAVNEQDQEFEDDGTTVEESVIPEDRSEVPERESALFADDEDIPPPIPARTKRLGYFDLHPERRPGATTPGAAGDRISVDSDAFSDDYPGLDTRQPILNTPHYDDVSSSYVSELEPEIDVTPNSSAIDIVPEPRRPAYVVTTPSPSAPAPAVATTSALSVSQPGQSKTASLIEMYREREKRLAPAGAPAASRLPVRTGASLVPATQLLNIKPTPAAPLESPVAPPLGTPMSETESDVESILSDIPEPNLPNRYVHGAPLHNVLEEEEEE